MGVLRSLCIISHAIVTYLMSDPGRRPSISILHRLLMFGRCPNCSLCMVKCMCKKTILTNQNCTYNNIQQVTEVWALMKSPIWHASCKLIKQAAIVQVKAISRYGTHTSAFSATIFGHVVYKTNPTLNAFM